MTQISETPSNMTLLDHASLPDLKKVIMEKCSMLRIRSGSLRNGNLCPGEKYHFFLNKIITMKIPFPNWFYFVYILKLYITAKQPSC